MFSNMKNQFREKTGKEVPKFTPHKGGLSRTSRQGSESSLASLVLDTPPTISPNSPAVMSSSPPDPHQIKLPDGKVLSPKEVNALSKKEDEWRSRMEKKESEWSKKLEKREEELLKQLKEKEDEWIRKEATLTEDLLKQTNELRDALHLAEDYKRKICQYQDDKDQLEGFQTQEMAKLKHLLLAKEKENTELTTSLKENISLVESLKGELTRLRNYEEQLNNAQDEIEMLRHTSEKEKANLSSRLAQSEEEVRHLTDKVALLTRRSESDAGLGTMITPDDRMQALLGERALLERRLEEAHIHLTDIKASWSAKISALETQVGRLSRQAGEEGVERRRAENRITELEAKLDEQHKESSSNKQRIESLIEERATLENELKTLKGSQDTLKSESSELNSKLQQVLTKKSQVDEENNKLVDSLNEERQKNSHLEEELETLRAELKATKDRANLALSEENIRNKDLEKKLESERQAKDDALLRNAQVSQDVDMTKRDLRLLQQETDELCKKVTNLEGAIKNKDQEINKFKNEVEELQMQLNTLQVESKTKKESAETVDQLRDTITDLEAQLADKTKSNKVLQQRLSDMKKTLQRELKGGGGDGSVPAPPNTSSGDNPVINNHISLATSDKSSLNSLHDDVNFQYLKHVIIKFLTCREYEAQHLTKAVATLLKLTPEEESLIRDTLEWKMSWFRSKPRLQDYSHS